MDFCYHYYWFSGRRVLQRPLEEMLQSGEPDFPFCICWANEPWSRRWDGSETEILIAQEHDLETDKRLIFDLLPPFADQRYIKVDGKPLLVIYRVGLLPSPRELFAAWREAARQHGLPGLHICMAETFGSKRFLRQRLRRGRRIPATPARGRGRATRRRRSVG